MKRLAVVVKVRKFNTQGHEIIAVFTPPHDTRSIVSSVVVALDFDGVNDTLDGLTVGKRYKITVEEA